MMTTTSSHFHFQILDQSQKCEFSMLLSQLHKCSRYSKLTFLKSCSASSLTCFIIFGGLPSSALILSTSKATNLKKKKKKISTKKIISFLFKLWNVNLKLKLSKENQTLKNVQCHGTLEHETFSLSYRASVTRFYGPMQHRKSYMPNTFL